MVAAVVGIGARLDLAAGRFFGAGAVGLMAAFGRAEEGDGGAAAARRAVGVCPAEKGSRVGVALLRLGELGIHAAAATEGDGGQPSGKVKGS